MANDLSLEFVLISPHAPRADDDPPVKSANRGEINVKFLAWPFYFSIPIGRATVNLSPTSLPLINRLCAGMNSFRSFR